MRERAEAMVLASFAADSHALGAHWIYDMDEIATRYGRVERLIPPHPASLHRTRALGDLTHYGDQALILLRHLAADSKYDTASFASAWERTMRDYNGYLDKATRQTLENIDAGAAPGAAGSGSTELSAAARIAPVVYRYRDERAQLIDAARAQAAVTHNSPIVQDAAEFFARVAWNALNGKTPSAAIESVLGHATSAQLGGLVQAGLEAGALRTREAAERFGQGCSATAAIPLTVYLIAAYEGSLKEALVENVAAGGDSAARGLIVGMILGAFHGRDAIPDDWIADLRAYPEISTLLEDLESTLQRAGTTPTISY